MHAHKRFTVATNVQVYFCDAAQSHGSAAAIRKTPTVWFASTSQEDRCNT